MSKKMETALFLIPGFLGTENPNHPDSFILMITKTSFLKFIFLYNITKNLNGNINRLEVDFKGKIGVNWKFFKDFF